MRRIRVARSVVAVIVLAGSLAQAQARMAYHLESATGDGGDLRRRFSELQLGILEKVNRADRHHLPRLGELVVPDEWVDDELAYSSMPARYEADAAAAKFLVLHLPSQAFGAYERGALVRWGPVSSGSRATPTPPGLFHLNWRSTGHTSSVDPDWFLPWYFNFENADGRALHEYALPGRPASHGCVRLLKRDAEWLFEWGDQWTLDASGTRVVAPGTPVLIVGAYDFAASPPWRSLVWLATPVALPAAR
jgi:hypothetical protein